MSHQQSIVHEFVKASETMKLDPTRAKAILHEEYSQTEYPNLLNRKGQTSNLTESLARMELAKKILKRQSFEISSLIEAANTVVMECLWIGEMSVDAGPLKAGQTLKAFFCMVFEFKDDKIFRIRNYDCFESF